MNRLMKARNIERHVRTTQVAKDIMTPNPVSVGQDTTVQQVAAVLRQRAISALPVINEAGRPVGVVSQTDIVRAAGGAPVTAPRALSCDDGSSRAIASRITGANDFDPKACDGVTVREIMTPEVFSIGTDATVVRIVEELLSKNVHRLFIVDDNGILVGVVTALDVLRSLRR